MSTFTIYIFITNVKACVSNIPCMNVGLLPCLLQLSIILDPDDRPVVAFVLWLIVDEDLAAVRRRLFCFPSKLPVTTEGSRKYVSTSTMYIFI